MTKRDWLPTMWSDWGEDEKSPFYALRRQIDSVLEDFDKDSFIGASSFHVRTNVSETEKEIRITAELPGIDRDDIEVDIVGDTITVKGEKSSEKEMTDDEEGREFHRLERRSGSFQRMMRLPFRIDPDKVVADVRNGVLTVTIPKPAELREQPRKIEIKQAA